MLSPTLACRDFGERQREHQTCLPPPRVGRENSVKGARTSIRPLNSASVLSAGRAHLAHLRRPSTPYDPGASSGRSGRGRRDHGPPPAAAGPPPAGRATPVPPVRPRGTRCTFPSPAPRVLVVVHRDAPDPPQLAPRARPAEVDLSSARARPTTNRAGGSGPHRATGTGEPQMGGTHGSRVSFASSGSVWAPRRSGGS